MNNYTLFATGRGGGKTHWLLQQISEAVNAGKSVALFTHDKRYSAHIARHFSLDRLPVDIYSERSFELARGHIYDAIYVDNAELFHDNPVEMCSRFFPGVPATFTYTPYPFD